VYAVEVWGKREDDLCDERQRKRDLPHHWDGGMLNSLVASYHGTYGIRSSRSFITNCLSPERIFEKTPIGVVLGMLAPRLKPTPRGSTILAKGYLADPYRRMRSLARCRNILVMVVDREIYHNHSVYT